MTALDWGIVASYLLLSLAIGLAYTRRASSSTQEFFLSGRNLPWWLAGTSMVATTFSSDTPLYVTGLVRTHGIYENWQWWGFLVGGLFAVFFLARLWRRLGVMTDVELIELRYAGRPAAVLRGFKAIYFSVAIHTIIKAQVILAMVKILDVALGWGKWEAIAVSSGVTLFYCLLSGSWGVVLTAFFQFLVARAGAIVLAVAAVHAAGGVEGIRAGLETQGQSEALHFFPPWEGDFLSTAFLTFCAYLGVQWWARYSSDGGGVIVQRMASCRDERHALWATFYFNLANYAVRTWPWVLAALASLVLYPAATDHELVYPRMMMDLLPEGLRGLVLASFFAAFMSTMSTYLNLSSAYFINDFYRRFVARGSTEAHYVRVARLSMLGLSLLTALVAYQVSSIVEVFKFLIAFGSGTGLVYLLRWYWWRVNAWSEIAAMVASMALSLALYLTPWGIALPYVTKLGMIVGGSTVVWLLATFLTAPVPEERLRAFWERTRPGGPGWRRFGAGEPLGPQIRQWAGGCLLVAGLTLGTGKWLLGAHAEGMFALAAAAVGLALMMARSTARPSGSGRDPADRERK
ncbi:MAG: Na+:solute symporter [Nitrospirae bacterium]|nr:Na+:solute symporter [Nitrospirota bacterium]